MQIKCIKTYNIEKYSTINPFFISPNLQLEFLLFQTLPNLLQISTHLFSYLGILLICIVLSLIKCSFFFW